MSDCISPANPQRPMRHHGGARRRFCSACQSEMEPEGYCAKCERLDRDLAGWQPLCLSHGSRRDTSYSE